MKRLSLLALSMLSAALISTPAALAQVNWTLGDVDSASHWGPKAGQQLAEAVDKATGGKLKITVYPDRVAVQGQGFARRGLQEPGADLSRGGLPRRRRGAAARADGPAAVRAVGLRFPRQGVGRGDAALPRVAEEEVRRLPGRHPAGRAAHDLHQDRVQGSRRPQGQEDPQRRSDRDRVHPRAWDDAGGGGALRDLHRAAAGPARRQLGRRCAAFLQQGLRGHQVHLRCRQRRSRVLRAGEREGDRRHYPATRARR